MAKKQSLNYGPNTGLVSGARDVAQSEAAMTSVGAAAFTQNFTSAILTGIEEQEKRNSIRDAYLTDLGGIQNINLLDEDYNKQAVTSFVRQKRDEYAKLADAYAKTKDTNILDKMENIKFSFSNLNNQLKGLANERVNYLEAYDKGQIIDIAERGDGIYTMAYTNKGQFSVDGTGNIGFNIDGKTTQFKDIAGKYNVKSNIGEAFVLEQGLKARNTGERGGKFYRDDTKNIYKFKFKETGPEGIMTMAKTDLTGDDDYTLANGQKAGNLSFESMWSQGLLDKKFYETFKAKGGTDWMYEDKNVNVLNDLISEYYTDVTESMYTPAKQDFDNKARESQKTGPSTYYLSGVAVNSESFNAVIPKFIKDLQNLKDGEYEKNTITGAGFVRKGKNKDGNPIYYRVSDIKDNKPIIDEDLGPMDLQGVGRYEGWGNYYNFDPLNPNK